MRKEKRDQQKVERLDYLDEYCDFIRLGIVECCYLVQVIRCIQTKAGEPG